MQPTPTLCRLDEIQAVPVRRPGRWIAARRPRLAAAVVRSVATNPRFEWGMVGEYCSPSRILDGLLLDARADRDRDGDRASRSASSLAVMRLSPNPLCPARAGSTSGSSAGRRAGAAVFWCFIAALYPTVGLGIPFGPEFVQVDANVLITPFIAAILGLALNEAAYMAEIVRAGILSVDRGQAEAAQALGMTRMQTMRRIVLPQAMRVIIPPTGNEMISMLKTTSLVSVIASASCSTASQLIYSVNFKTDPAADRGQRLVPGRHDACSTLGQSTLERHYGRGRTRAATPLQRGRSAMRLTQARLRWRDRWSRRGRAQALRRARGAAAASTSTCSRGEVICLIGPSGSGKSTFLRCINHLERDRRRPAVRRRRAGRLPAGQGDKLYELRETRDRRAARARSGWCSSTSTCSRT